MVVKREGSSWCDEVVEVRCRKARIAGLLIVGVFGGPVVLVAEAPEENAGVVVVLGDHVAEHAARHLFEDVVADAAAAPGDLFPDEDAEPVAEIEHAARLLVVREADEVAPMSLMSCISWSMRSSGMAAA